MNIQLDNILASFRRFCCFVTKSPVFLQFGPRVQQYVWQGVICMVILFVFLSKNQTIFFKEKLVREDYVLKTSGRLGVRNGIIQKYFIIIQRLNSGFVGCKRTIPLKGDFYMVLAV